MLIKKNDNTRIGIFDSGLGGLSVLNELTLLLPNVSFDYLGDCARLPYGVKSPKVILEYARKGCEFFKKRGVKKVIFACNTLSAQALPSISEEENELEIFSILEPSANEIVKCSLGNSIAIIATEATIKSGWYQKRILELLPTAKVITQACGILVAMVEEGIYQGPLANKLIQKCLKFMFDEDEKIVADSLLLGCTHFSLLLPAIQHLLPKSITVVNPSQVIAEYIASYFLSETKINKNTQQTINLFFTDAVSSLDKKIKLFLEKKPNLVQIVDL